MCDDSIKFVVIYTSTDPIDNDNTDGFDTDGRMVPAVISLDPETEDGIVVQIEEGKVAALFETDLIDAAEATMIEAACEVMGIESILWPQNEKPTKEVQRSIWSCSGVEHEYILPVTNLTGSELISFARTVSLVREK